MSSVFKSSAKNSSESKVQGLIQLLALLTIGFFELKNAPIRMSYGDAPFCFFQLIVNKWFWVPHDRYTGYLMQWLPVLAIKMNLGYKIAYYLYALNTYIVGVVFIWIYHRFFRDSLGVWVLILTLVMGMSSSYYYYTPDHTIGYLLSVLSTLIFAHHIKKNEDYLWIYTVIISLVCIWCNLYHCILICIGLTYILFENKSKYKYVLLQFGIIIGMILIIKKLWPSTAYEEGKLNLLRANLIHFRELDSAAFRYYFDSIFGGYKLLNYLYGTIFLIGILRKKFIELALGGVVYFTLFYLNCLYNFNWESNAYMDLYGRIIFISVLMCSYFILKESKLHWTFISAIFIFMLYINASLIVQKYEVYYGRHSYLLGWLDRMEEKGVQKLAIDESQLDYNKLLLDWALAYETLVLSTYQGRPATICAKEIQKKDKPLWKEDVLYGRFHQEPYDRFKFSKFGELPLGSYVFIVDSMDRL